MPERRVAVLESTVKKIHAVVAHPEVVAKSSYSRGERSSFWVFPLNLNLTLNHFFFFFLGFSASSRSRPIRKPRKWWARRRAHANSQKKRRGRKIVTEAGVWARKTRKIRGALFCEPTLKKNRVFFSRVCDSSKGLTDGKNGRKKRPASPGSSHKP